MGRQFVKKNFTAREIIPEIIFGTLLFLGVGWLCFRNLFWSLGGLIFLPVYLRSRWLQKEEQKKRELQREFRDVVAILYSSVAVGGTLEKALKDATRDMKNSAGRYPLLLPEFERICFRLERRLSLESVLNSFARQSRDEDIRQFVQVLLAARKSGSAMSEVIQHTADAMIMRMEMNAEIDTVLAGRKGELKIMLLIPAGILIYLNICSPDYIGSLYTTLTGRCVMVAALGIYGIAVYIGRKILDIHI